MLAVSWLFFTDGVARPAAASARRSVSCFLPIAPRTHLSLPANKLDATETDLAELRASTQQMTPTIDAIQHWSVVSAQPSPEGLRGELLLPLFQVVRADTKAFVRVLKATLQRISKDSLDDYLMERQLAAWRRLMNDMQAELPTVRDSFHSFLSFLSGPGDDAVCKAVKDMVAELNEDIWDLQKRIDSTYAALRVDMQFSESRRSIMEAKTLTKLTELAFIFIPLSFVSSLFSMSVKELEGGVPIWTFVLTAIAMASLAYGIRWIVANDFLAESSRRALERFWAKRNVSRGARVPVITLALLTIQDVWETGGRDLFLKILLSVVLPAFLLVPVGFLWHSTGLDTGFKLSVTLLLVVSGLAAALLPSLAGLAGQSPSQSLLARFNRRFGRRSFDVNGDSGSEEGEEETESV